MDFSFNQAELLSFEDNIRREWAITNGIGGYCGSSIIGAHNRTHQGYLIASFHPPVDRYICFSKTDETIFKDGTLYDLTTAQHKGGVRTNGNQYLSNFSYDGNVHFEYSLPNVSLKKTIFMIQGENKVVVKYTINNSGNSLKFNVIPHMNFREHNDGSTVDTLSFDTIFVNDNNTGFPIGFFCNPTNTKSNYQIFMNIVGKATIEERQEKYDIDIELQTEVDNEVDGLDTTFTPYTIIFDVPANQTTSFALLCEAYMDNDAFKPEALTMSLIDKYYIESKSFYKNLIDDAALNDDFADALVLASNQFIAHRDSTGYKTVLAGLPWFTDWGRDTMIAFTGLTLCTNRLNEARDILKTFSMYLHNGMVPNMFPDNGEAPLYNTVDASLWYFYAVERYLKYAASDEAYVFIQNDIYPCLKEIIKAYKNGTDFSIYMDSDYLIHAGSGLDQVTWMDVRVGDWVATPRHGKPVEINALWYNALMVMNTLALRFKDSESASYLELASKVKASFLEKFWYEDGNYLYDVYDEVGDPTLRPNQLFAVSLPYSMLDNKMASSVVEVCTKKLLAGPGIRSLTPDSPDYHPIYLGSLDKRDHAYHQGTAWGFLMGTYLSAYMKVNNHSNEAAKKALEILEPVKWHMQYERCIGSISEIFDGDAPNSGRGCYAQAWSVGEVLRAYCEDIKPYYNL